eukprot:10780847-Ditylum_brightwellii.AAC.1
MDGENALLNCNPFYFQSGMVEISSDGLVKEGCGTYAIIFKSGNQEVHFQGPVDCHPSLL